MTGPFKNDILINNNKSFIVKGTTIQLFKENKMKKQEAFGQINAMSGIVKLETIINTLKSIDNFQEETINKLKSR